MRKKIITGVVGAIALYMFVYPAVLFCFPRRDGSLKATDCLKLVYTALLMYHDDYPDAGFPSREDICVYLPTDYPDTCEVHLVDIQNWPLEQQRVLVAWTAVIPRVRSAKSMGFLFGIRGWPNEDIPERRGLMYSDGNIEIIPETRFRGFQLER